MLTFAFAYVSNFNIVSMETLTLTKRIGIEPALCICVLLPLLLLFLKTQTQTLMLSVNGPLQFTTLLYYWSFNVFSEQREATLRFHLRRSF